MNATIDQQFIEFIVKSVVSKPDAVKVDRRVDEKGVLLELTVDPEDLGRVIGKRGATAQSLRTLLRALGTKNDARYNLKIIDTSEGERPSRSSDDAGAPVAAPTQTSSDDNDDYTSASDISSAQDESEESEEKESDSLRKTRQELSDLDDLDI